MKIRRFRPGDERALSEMIALTLRTTNRADYSPEYLESVIARHRPEDLRARAAVRHFYVAEQGGALIGCAAIGPYWDRAEESCVFTFFVHPAYQRQGVGTRLMQALERDEYALRAKRIEVPASVTGAPFYSAMGYTFKPHGDVPDCEGLLRMEKNLTYEEGQKK